jgi:hypothetical protein
MEKKWKRPDISIPVKYMIITGETGGNAGTGAAVMPDGSILNAEGDLLKMLIEKGARAGDVVEVEMEIFELLQDNRFTAEVIQLNENKPGFETAVLKIREMLGKNRRMFMERVSEMQTETELRGEKKEKRIWTRLETFLNVKYNIIAHEGDAVNLDSYELHFELPYYGRILDISEGGLKFFKDTNSVVKVGDVLEVRSDIPNIAEDQHFFIKTVADRGEAKRGGLFGCVFLKVRKTLRDRIIDYIARKS